MAWPLLGPDDWPITTPYGRRGGSWSCNPDSAGNGVHTGVDMACPSGTPLYAAIAGQVRHRNYGSAFGSHQFAISPDPGQPYASGEVFYAHARKRAADGTRVSVGDWVGESGAEGNVTGPHLHFEYHPNSKGSWSCSAHADPAEVLEHAEGPPHSNGEYPDPTSGTVYLSKLRYGVRDSDSVWYLQNRLNSHKLEGGHTLSLTGNYLDATDTEVRLCQGQHGFGADPPGASFVGPEQAEHLFAGSAVVHTVVDDT